MGFFFFSFYEFHLFCFRNFTYHFRILQSEIYEVIDAIYYDPVTSDTTNNYYLNTTNTSISYTDGKIVVTNLNNNGSYCDLRTLLNSVKGKTVRFKVDVEVTNLEARLEFLPKGSPTVYSNYTSTDATLQIDSIDVPNDATNGFFRINTRYGSEGASFKFKNFTVYLV